MHFRPRTIASFTLITLGIIPLALAQTPAPAGSSPSTPRQLKRTVDYLQTLNTLKTRAAPSGAFLTYFGGPIIEHPTYYAVSWGAGVDPAISPMVDQFLMSVGGSLDFNSVLNQYAGRNGARVEFGTFGGHTIATPDAKNGGTPVDDVQIQSQLQSWIDKGVLPQNTADSIYILLFPPNITITSGGQSSCQAFCGYHGTINGNNGQYIYYAVLPDFGKGSGCDRGCGRSTVELNNFTSVLSHEVAETITDPAVGLANSLAFPVAWYDQAYGEIGDICNAQQATVLGWTVQMEFSNAENDCIAVRPNFSLHVAGGGSVPAGGTGTLTVASTALQNQAAQSIALSVAGLPSGVTGTFTPNIITAGQSSTLSLTAIGSATPGTVNAAIFAGADVTAHSITVPITVTAKSAVLAVTKTHAGSFTQGQTGVTYTITVTNRGAAATAGTIAVSDALPPGLAATSIAGASWNCTQPAGPCSRSDALGAGASYPAITITVNVAANAASPLVNVATVSGGGLTPATASDSTTINSNSPPILGIAKTHSGSFAQGKTGTYLVTVTDAPSAGAASGQVTVTEIPPPGMTVLSMSGLGWACTGNTCSRSDTLSGGNSYPGITVAVSVAANAVTPQINVVGVSGGGSASATASDSTVISSGPAILVPANLTLNPGDQTPFAITLSSPAPSGGVFLNLTVSNPSLLSLNVNAVLIPEGQMTSSRAQLTGIGLGTATVTASASGFAPGTTQVQVGSPGGTLTLSPSSLTINPPGTQNLTLTLSPAAPNGGLTVNLSSNNPSVASVGTPVFVPANAASVSVPVTGLTGGTATITASAPPGYPATSATVTVISKLTITTPSLANGQVGTQYSQGLTAAGGLPPYSWSLTSGALPGLLSLNPATGLISGIPQAAVTNTPLTFKVTDSSATAQGAVANFTLTIGTAPTVGSIQTVSGTPQSTAVNTLFPSPLTALVKDTAGNPMSGVQVIFAAPPAGPGGTFAGGGITFAGTTNGAGLATPPAFAANSTAGNYIVTALAPGVSTPAIFSLTNTAVSGPAIVLPASVVLNPGDQTILALSLSAPAPAGGVFVTLTNGNPQAVALNTINVFIPQGQSGSSVARVTGSAVGSSTITASASGYLSASTQVQVGGSLPLAITTTALVSGQVNKAYAQTLAATGGTLPYSWSLIAGSLPGGLTLNAATGLLGGVPAVTVTNLPLTFQVTDSSSPAKTAPVNLTLTISPPGTAAAIVAAGGTPQTAGINALFAAPLLALVKDSGGNPVSGAVVTFIVPSSGPSASFAGGVATATTNASGLAASAILTANSLAGSYTVMASTPGAAAPAVYSLTNVSGPVILLPGTITLNPGDQSVFTVSLSAPAPAGGVFITLSSSDYSVVGLTTANVFIGEGQTSSTRARVNGLIAGLATITATASGFAPASSQVQVGPL